MKTLEQLIRPHLRKLNPCTSIEEQAPLAENVIRLNANENPYNKPLNRYPDPLQLELKKTLSALKKVPTDNIYLGNGSEEAIDLIYRIFCEPKVDNVVAIAPTRMRYKRLAEINNIGYKPVLLDTDFQIQPDKLLHACDQHTKVVWICSPNDPTGKPIQRDAIHEILTLFDGIVVVDKSFIDFSHQPSIRHELKKYSNLIVLDTMSTAYGCAALRLGMAYATKEIIELFNNIKYPFNISSLAQKQAIEILKDSFEIDKWVSTIVQERTRMLHAFSVLPECTQVYASEGNFFLAKMKDAGAIYQYLREKGISVCDCSHLPLCENCIRVTIGSKTENNLLLAALRQYY